MTAGGTLLATTHMALKQVVQGDVYSNYAPQKQRSDGDVWYIIRVISERLQTWRADRDSAVCRLSVCSVSSVFKEAEKGAEMILDRLNLSGYNDSRRTKTLPANAKWHILSCDKERAVRVLPSPDLGLKYFESGYIFSVNMEAKNGYV